MALGSREGQICGSNLYERLLAFPVWPCDVSVCKWETCTAVGQMESSVRAGRLGASIPMRMREHQNLVQALLGACFRLCGCSSLRCFVVLWALAWFYGIFGHMHTEARCWLEWMGWLPKTVAHANPSRIQRVGETSASAEGTEDNSSFHEERRRWVASSAQSAVASKGFQWEANRSATSAAPPPHPPPRCRFFLLFLLAFFSCYSCLLFFSCYCLACFSFLLILACFSFLLILAGFSFLLFVFLAGFSFLVLLAGFSEDLEAPCATHSADAMQLEPHGSASAGTSSFATQAHCFGSAIEHLRKVQLHVLPERV